METPTTSYTLGTSAFVDIVLTQDVEAVSVFVNSGTLIYRGTTPGARVYLDAVAVENAGGGKVDLVSTAHGCTIGDSIYIPMGQLVNYSGAYVLQAGGTVDRLRIIATYVAETPAVGAYINGYRDAILPATTPIALEGNCPAGKAIFKGKGSGGDCVISVIGVG